MASEEIRVDCALLTKDGRYVVTGSLHGPPQVWDLRVSTWVHIRTVSLNVTDLLFSSQSGALVRIMEGEDFSSTDLNLAADDSLLVGQVAELTPVDGGEPARASNLHHRKLQVHMH